MEAQNTEVRSSEIRELLNDTPSWFVRWGTVFILLAVAGMVGVSWFIKYPDIVRANVTISNSNPPVPVISPMKGILDSVFVNEGQQVIEEQKLAVFSAPGTKYSDIRHLESKLDVFSSKNTETFSEFSDYVDDPGDENDQLELGSIRPAFNEFIGQLRAYAIESAGNRNARKIYELRKEIVELKSEIGEDKAKIPELKRRVNLKEVLQGKEQKRLSADKSLSSATLEKIVNEKNNAQAELDDFIAEIERKEDKVIRLGRGIKDLEATKDTGIARILNEINIKRENIDSEVKKWKRIHLLYAPIGGKISFYEKKGEKRKLFFNEGDYAMAILAEDKGEYVARIELGKEHNGKVEEGDKILIKLPSFPHQEYGKLRGQITHIPKILQNDFYAVEAKLPSDTLLTTFKKTIPFEQQLVGTAEIITDDKRLFQRIYEKVF